MFIAGQRFNLIPRKVTEFFLSHYNHHVNLLHLLHLLVYKFQDLFLIGDCFIFEGTVLLIKASYLLSENNHLLLEKNFCCIKSVGPNMTFIISKMLQCPTIRPSGRIYSNLTRKINSPTFKAFPEP